MKSIVYIYALILFVMTACRPSPSSGDTPVLTVTLEPLRYFTETIAGDKFQVVSMVPKGSSPETYDPTPQQLVSLSQSQGYLRIGYIGFEQAWMEKLTTTVPTMKVFDTSKGVDLIRSVGHHHGDHYHEGGIEPHIWNSTKNAQTIADNICTALIELDPANQTFYQHRTDSLKQIIQETDLRIRQLLRTADRTFLIYHPALSYFARDYGLKQISMEDEGKEPSPAQLKKMIETCRKENIHVIFVQQEFDTRNARIIADELELDIIPIQPLSYDWPTEMIHIAQSLTPNK